MPITIAHPSFRHNPTVSRRVALGALGLILACSTVGAEPTPYPDAKDESAWRGEGPIRVHPWMIDNRAHFWSRRESDQGAVVFAGSSGIGNWKSIADAFPGLKVANRGVGGDTSRGLLFRFEEDVLDLNPTGIVLLIGSNDLSAHADPIKIQNNIAALIDAARAKNASVPIVLCTLPPRNNPKAPTRPGAVEATNAKLTELGAAKSVVLADLYSPFATPERLPIPELFHDDSMHFSTAGYDKLGEILRSAIAKAGVTIPVPAASSGEVK